MLNEIKESLFLSIANNLPRLNIFNALRYKIIKLAGVNVIGKCNIWSGFDIRPIGNSCKLTIGDGVFINRNLRIAMPGDVSVIISNNVAIGPNVMLECAYHGFNIEDRKKTFAKSIYIEENVWIGAGAIVLAGVRIGKNSVVAAGAVVTKNVPENVLVAGVPAKIKKELK